MKKQTETAISSAILDKVGEITKMGDIAETRLLLNGMVESYFQSALEDGSNVSREYKLYIQLDELFALLDDLSKGVKPKF